MVVGIWGVDEDVERLEVILKLTRELGVNLAGVEIILNMREKMEAMQRQIEEFVKSLNSELVNRTPSEQPAQMNSLVPVIRALTIVTSPAPKAVRKK